MLLGPVENNSRAGDPEGGVGGKQLHVQALCGGGALRWWNGYAETVNGNGYQT